MKATRLYAQVLVDVAAAPSAGVSLDTVMAELKEVAKGFQANPITLKIFDNPTLADEEKQKILKELNAKAKLSAFADRFLSLLVRKSRIGILQDILNEVSAIQLAKKGGVMGQLVSAVPLESGVITGVAEALSKKLNKPVQLEEKVDPGMIAGMRVTISGVTYDGSVRSKLDKLAGSFR